MKYKNDERIVLTLDAGGTNFVFSAIRGGEQIVEEIVLPSNADNLELSLKNIVDGFNKVKNTLPATPSAISFAFPGPADYPKGIIGDLGNLPAYRGGIALGPMLQEIFGIPVFINNDGDLYAYGEAIAGLLPYINSILEKAGSSRRYKNLLGLTLGTGFGAGIVRDGELYIGDNAIAGEIWLLRDKFQPNCNIEEHASIRAVQRIYAEKIGIEKNDSPSPKEIYEIAIGKLNGNKEAAIEAFRQMAEAVGDAICNAITLLDGLVVIGGGLAGASSLFMPFLINEMNSEFTLPDNSKLSRLVAKVYNFEDETDLQDFVKGSEVEITIPGFNKIIKYDPTPRIGVGISKIGTSRAISIGAYAFALSKLDSVN